MGSVQIGSFTRGLIQKQSQLGHVQNQAHSKGSFNRGVLDSQSEDTLKKLGFSVMFLSYVTSILNVIVNYINIYLIGNDIEIQQ